MPTAEVNGQRLYHELHGDSGEPLVCVMGIAANTLAWTLQVPAFAERHRTLIFDNRDVGRSSMATASYGLADMAQDALELGAAVRFDRFHLLGVSMGGAIAQEMALAAPERVATLTLAVTWGGAGAYGLRRSSAWARRRPRLSFEEHVDELMLLNHSEEFFENEALAEEVRRLILDDPHPQPAEAFVRQLHASGRHETRTRLPALELPVHVIGAERDQLVPVWKSQELAELMPGARLTLVEGAPHGVTIERAEHFNRLVLDFIAEHAPASVG